MDYHLDPALQEPHYALQTHLGFKMVAWEKHFAAFELPLAPFLMNRYGIPHGGIYATMLDTAMGYAGCYTGSPEEVQLAMTLSLTTNFVGRPVGERLVIEARQIGGGRSTFFTEGTVKDETGVLVATGSGTFRYRARK
ncbi:PaaI family thioesterase [Acuticoccus sp. M5D2P5]|uniref:PaaI family thioesterase n=1 Tax=Acuticoccus kalidii TaxID=2910977 RepID=UPI001F3BD94B|nr:PaaI family thioesterase [Acuticoccus kalidii]MCF3933080.1 PaaI family thioesterase [Acuticoccus kalidii]